MTSILTSKNVSINYEYITCNKYKAETLLLVHGLGLDLSIWDEIVGHLKNDYHILRYDLRGHGKSLVYEREELTWNLLVSDLELLLSGLEISSFHLIAHAGGGNLGIELERQQKNYLQSMTLLSTPIYTPKDISINEIKQRNKWNKQESFESNLLPIAKNICYPATSDKVNRLLTIFRKTNAEDYFAYFNLLGETILNYKLEEFHRFTIPKLLLVGEFDSLYPPQLQMMNLSYLSNTRFYIIPNASNMIMMDHPERLVEDTVNFITGLESDEDKEDYTYTKLLEKELNSIVDTGIRLQNNSIYLNIIDKFELVIDGVKIEGKWNQRKAMQLITYIIYHQRVTREQLYDTFWPYYDIKKARNHLRVSISHIRSIIETCMGKEMEEYFVIDRNTIALKNKAVIDIDKLQNVISRLEQWRNDQEKLDKTLSVFSELPETICAGFYDDWIIQLKNSIENKILDICEGLLSSVIDNKDKIELLKLLIKFNPIEEYYYQKLIHLLEELGMAREISIYRKKLNHLQLLD